MHRIVPSFLLPAFVFAACIGPEVDDEATGDGPSVQTDPVLGIWVGYREGVGSEWDRVELTVTAHDDAGIAATIRFGEGPELEQATDPDVGFPAELPVVGEEFTVVVQGFEYQLRGTFDETLSRLEGDFPAYAVWNDWCALQTSFLIPPDLYSCLPNCGYSLGLECGVYECEPPASASLEGSLDCQKLRLCAEFSVCSCTSEGCAAVETRFPLDLRIRDETMEGSIEGVQGTIYLSRQQGD